jgi:hypothetical protein
MVQGQPRGQSLVFACYPNFNVCAWCGDARRSAPIVSQNERIDTMPPFTFDETSIWEAVARLADDNDHSWRFTKRGDKRPLCDIDASVTAKKRSKAAKQLAATERTLAAANARNLCRALPGQSIADRMLRAMQPAEWYGQGDIARMAGVSASARAKVHQVLLRRGWVEKARNPAFRGILDPWSIMAGAEPEPLHLFRLTELGLNVRAALPHEPPN